MVAVLQRYKFILIIISIMISALIIWFMVSRFNVQKIPSRGVFVIGKVMR